MHNRVCVMLLLATYKTAWCSLILPTKVLVTHAMCSLHISWEGFFEIYFSNVGGRQMILSWCWFFFLFWWIHFLLVGWEISSRRGRIEPALWLRYTRLLVSSSRRMASQASSRRTVYSSWKRCCTPGTAEKRKWPSHKKRKTRNSTQNVYSRLHW